MSVIYIVIGLVLLVLGGELLVRSSVALSFKLNISKMVIGMTVVSFATSAPELLVSLQAALDGSPAIAINNVIGSNIANIGMVLGITALIGPIVISKDFYRVNWPVMVLFSLALWGMLSYNNDLNGVEGGVLLVGLVVFLVYLIKNAKSGQDNEEVDDTLAEVGYLKIFIWLLIGGLALYFGSELLVDGAKTLARDQGISEGVISVTMIAIGTSVPELAASVIAAVKGEKAISLGNLLGSNIFNIASVLGFTSLITTIKVTESQILSKDIFWMLGFSFVLLPMAYFYKKNEIGRVKGGILLIGYISFIYLTLK